MGKRHKKAEVTRAAAGPYGSLLVSISQLLDESRRTATRTVNSILTGTYWEIGRQIVEFEQGGETRAEYGQELLKRLGQDLTARHGRGFGWRNLFNMRNFYLGWEILQTPSAKFESRIRLSPEEGVGDRICSTLLSELEVTGRLPCLGCNGQEIFQTVSGKSGIGQTVSAELLLASSSITSPVLGGVFPLSWSHYVRLMSVEKPHARAFYEAEAIRGGWSVRQLDRQISTQFFERISQSTRREAMLARGQKAKPGDAVSVQDEIRDPYLLEFLNLKDEYSESELEDALVRHLEWFLLELGAGFTFVARQKRIRVGDEWYRIDLLLYHRRLRCLVVIDLKLGKFTHADAGQMNLYLNYARERMMEPEENDPVGLILCSGKNDAVVHYAMGGIQAKVFASRYLTALPNPETLKQEILTAQHALETRAAMKGPDHG